MSMLKSFVIAVCALSTIIGAAPVPEAVVTEVVTQTFWETVNCTATVWKDMRESPVATTTGSTAGQSHTRVSAPAPVRTTTSRPAPAKPTTTTTTTTTIPTTTTTVATTTTPPPPPPPSSSVAPPTTPAYTPPTVTTSEAPLPPSPTTTEAPVTTPPAPAPTTTQPPAAPVQTSPIVASPSNAPGNFVQASASNSCEGTDSACEGEITHWDGGLGACGWSVSTDSELAVALPVGLMGAQSNGNPYCGRSVTLRNPTTGTTIQAKVGDKCMGCEGRAIDLTNMAFKAVTDGTGDGRETGFQWWFSS